MTVLPASTIAVAFTAGIAAADSPVPQPAGVCNKAAGSSAALDNAQTFAPNGDVLMCVPGPQVGLWQRVGGIQRPIQAWYTYGPEVTLAAADVAPSGLTWVGWNQDPDKTPCTAEQIPAGGPTAVMPIRYDQLQDFHLIPNLTTLKLKGSCSWRPAGSSPYGP